MDNDIEFTFKVGFNYSAHSCLKIALNNYVCNYDISENNFGIKLKFAKYLKGSFGFGSH